MTRAIEIGCGTWVSWDAYHAGAQSMRSNGKSRLKSTAACWVVVTIALLAPVGGTDAEQRGSERSGSVQASDEGTSANWYKYAGNPVLGGDLGTCFDVTMLQEDGKYRLWFSWRPKESVALVESQDGVHWSEPQIVLSPNPVSGWEGRINRPAVV